MISQTEYDCPAHESDPWIRVLQWIVAGTVVCLLVLAIAFGMVMLA